MGGIVIELQREAMDENISIESLLRKAYLVARKLKLKEFEEWINKEQNGYSKEVPNYRNVAGEIKDLTSFALNFCSCFICILHSRKRV